MSLIPIKVLARELGKTERTLFRWIAAGEGPAAYKIGGAIMYRRDEVDAWVEAQRIRPENVEALAA